MIEAREAPQHCEVVCELTRNPDVIKTKSAFDIGEFFIVNILRILSDDAHLEHFTIDKIDTFAPFQMPPSLLPVVDNSALLDNNADIPEVESIAPMNIS